MAPSSKVSTYPWMVNKGVLARVRCFNKFFTVVLFFPKVSISNFLSSANFGHSLGVPPYQIEQFAGSLIPRMGKMGIIPLILVRINLSIRELIKNTEKISKSMSANTTRILVSNCKSVTKNKMEKSKIKKATKMDDSRNATLKFFILKPLVI